METSETTGQGINAIPEQVKPLEQSVINSGRFSKVEYLGRGASGVAFRVTDKNSGIPALLKMAEGTELTPDLLSEFNIVSGTSREGLNDVASYPVAQLPADTVIEPTMRGLSKIRNSQSINYFGLHPAILLEWLEEVRKGEPGFHRLDKLIPEKSGTWTDLEILEIIAPFAYLLAEAHKKGIVYNDMGADKTDHLYYDETKHQLKVIDWANAVDTTRASYDGSRKPYHDVIGLVELIYIMRTGENPRNSEGLLDAKLLKFKLWLKRHKELGNLVRDCLEEKTITDGSGLYEAIETSIKSLREKSKPQPTIETDQPPLKQINSTKPRIHITRQPDIPPIHIERKSD